MHRAVKRRNKQTVFVDEKDIATQEALLSLIKWHPETPLELLATKYISA